VRPLTIIAPLIVVLLILLCIQTAWCQISIPNTVDTQFDTTQLPSPYDLFLTRESPTDLSSYATIGYRNELTVRTNQSNRGRIDDFHDAGRFVVAATHAGSGRSKATITVLDSTAADTLFTNEGSTLIDADGNLNRRAILVDGDLGRDGHVRLGYELQNYAATGTSNLYAGIFGIFPQTPPFELHKDIDTGSIDVDYKLPWGWGVETLVARADAPGEIRLAIPLSSPSLSLPLNDSGTEWTVAVTKRMNKSLGFTFYRSRGSWAGGGSVLREGHQVIGQGQNTRTQDDLGLSGKLALSGGRRLTVFYTTRHDTWLTAGLVPAGGDLGLAIPFIENVHYTGDYNLITNTIGADYSKPMGRGQSLDFGYRWITLLPLLEGSYALDIIVVPRSGYSKTGGTWDRAHELRLGYSVQRGRMRYRLEIDQAIPVTSSSHGHSGGTTGPSAPGPTKSSDGGRNIQFTIRRDF